MEWCSKRENIRWSQIIEQHDQWEASYGEWVLDGMEYGYTSAWIWRQTRSIHAHGLYENTAQLMANESGLPTAEELLLCEITTMPTLTVR